MFFPRQFRWREELARLSLLNRQIFLVHTFFIVLVVTMMGARQFGSTWRSRMRGVRTPSARHGSTYSFSLMDSTLPRTSRA